uniref:Uncharacterized protein n=1 Tax=Anguilla anguilla TaxID=7936 RepID=A0A0E9XQL5_ANGAN
MLVNCHADQCKRFFTVTECKATRFCVPAGRGLTWLCATHPYIHIQAHAYTQVHFTFRMDNCGLDFRLSMLFSCWHRVLQCKWVQHKCTLLIQLELIPFIVCSQGKPSSGSGSSLLTSSYVIHL